MATNDITGDEIRSKASSEKFRAGWDTIFGKKGKAEEETNNKDTDSKEDTDGKLQ